MIYFSFTCLCVFVCGYVHVSVGALRSQGAHTTAGAVPQPFILVLMIITGSQLLYSKDTILNAGTSELLPVKLLSKRRAVCGGLLAGRVAWGCSVCVTGTLQGCILFCFWEAPIATGGVGVLNGWSSCHKSTVCSLWPQRLDDFRGESELSNSSS